MDIWLITALCFRVLLLVSASAAIGGLFFRWFLAKHYQKYALWGALAGCLTSVCYFFIYSGYAYNEGLMDMFNPGILSMMWDEGLGHFCLLWFLGFLTIFLGLLAEKKLRLSKKITLFCIACGLIAYGTGLMGHTKGLQAGQVLIGLHLLIAAWWAGCLMPLAWYCNEPLDEVKRVMTRFGHIAIAACLILIICGLLLVIQLLPSFTALWTSNFGLMFLLKLIIVISIFTLAARHKLALVPKLNSKRQTALKTSIYAEALVMLFLLITSVVLSQSMTPG